MAKITISELRPIETEFEELSDSELESVAGGGDKIKIKIKIKIKKK